MVFRGCFGRETARLPRVDIRHQSGDSASTTAGSLHSCLFLRLPRTMTASSAPAGRNGKEAPVVSTGGLASLSGTDRNTFKHVDDLLTLDGSALDWERNSGGKVRARWLRFLSGSAAPLRSPPSAEWFSWKTTSPISPKSNNSFSGAGEASYCCRHWMGCSSKPEDAGIPPRSRAARIAQPSERY